MPGGVAAWVILTQQQRGGAEVVPEHVCFTYGAGTAATYSGAAGWSYATPGTASYGGTAGWGYAGTLDTTFSYAGEC